MSEEWKNVNFTPATRIEINLSKQEMVSQLKGKVFQLQKQVNVIDLMSIPDFLASGVHIKSVTNNLAGLMAKNDISHIELDQETKMWKCRSLDGKICKEISSDELSSILSL